MIHVLIACIFVLLLALSCVAHLYFEAAEEVEQAIRRASHYSELSETRVALESERRAHQLTQKCYMTVISELIDLKNKK